MKKHLAKLLGIDEAQVSNFDIKYLSINHINVNPFQPRKHFNIENLNELKESILQFGVLQPIIVRKVSDVNYELVAGERRWRASQLAGLKAIPAIIKEINDQLMAEIALIENLQRENLSSVDEAHAYKQLMEQFEYTQDQLSQRIGKSQPFIANKIRLLQLPDFVLQEVSNMQITERHARALLKVKDELLLSEILTVIINDNLTVKETEQLIAELLDHNISQEINKSVKPKKQKRKIIIKDFRLFKNSIEKSIKTLKESGFSVSLDENLDENIMELHIVIKK